MNNDPKENVPVLEHDADGIQELDNLLPRWWVWLFWGCNIFAVGYMLYFHTFNMGDLQLAAYAKEARAGDALKSAALAEFEGAEFSRFKEVLSDLMIATVGAVGREMKRLEREPGEIDAVLRRGVEAARAISEPILREVHDIVGFLRP